MIVNGVFIEATDGTLYVSSNWTSSKAPNSIVVAGDSVRFRISVSQPSSTMQMGSTDATYLENYMTAIKDETAAKADYDGAGNTANILKAVSNTSYVASYCSNFIFPNGRTKGFLPSLGQLNLAYQNKAAVNAALTACGGSAMSTSDSYWSSTFWGYNYNDSRFCWGLRWSDGGVYEAYVLHGHYARPFGDY